MAAAAGPYIAFEVLTGHVMDLLSYQGTPGPSFVETHPWYPRIFGMAWVSSMCFVMTLAVIGYNTAIGNLVRRYAYFMLYDGSRYVITTLLCGLAWNMFWWPTVWCFVCAAILSYLQIRLATRKQQNIELSDLQIALVVTLHLIFVILCAAEAYSMNTATPPQQHIDWP